MEDIIIWIVLIAIGALWEFVGKKKGESRSRTHSGTPAPAPFKPVAQSSSPAPAKPVAQSTSPAKSSHFSQEKSRPVYKPMRVENDQELATVEILSDTPLTDTPLSIDTDTPTFSDAAQTASDREAHFRRWRQAIIDTQVLERKF